MSSPALSVEVSVVYLPQHSHPARGEFRFAYTIRIINAGTAPAQIIARRWVIDNQHGLQEEVRGLGVVGQQPVLAPGESYEYTSSCHLHTASGSMRGHYLCVTMEGEPFECPIPRFELDARMPGWQGDLSDIGHRVLH